MHKYTETFTKMNDKFSFSWTNLSAWCIDKNEGKKTKRIILNKVSGAVVSGSLLAVMGASGVGKTTFLASLACKNKDKEGCIMFNDSILEENNLKYISSYVYQTDIIVDSLTVMEHMIFMGAFKLNKSSLDTTHIIDNILMELNLENAKNTLLKHLSGGEKKRVSLGVEMLNDPLILFCDEPTTGLDSSSAITLIQKLRTRTVTEKLVILTIHQPSSQLFEYFTDIILLSNGRIFYQGSREAITDYFKSLNLYCPKNYNPAEFYIKSLSTVDKNDQPKNGININFFFNNSLYIQRNCESSKIADNHRQHNTVNLCQSLYWLTWRTFIDAKRNFGYHMLQFLLLLITACILASFYSMVESNGEYSVQNIKGILYFFTSELIFTHTYNVVNTFSEEYAILLREKSLYSTHAYFISKVIAIIPRNIVQPFSFLLINFMFVEFLSGYIMFFQIWGILIFGCICGSMIGLCISAIFTSLEYMDLFIAPFELITMLAAGILININSVVFFRWFRYLSPFYYTYESLSIIHWTKINVIDCKNTTAVCYSNGKEILKDLGFYTEHVYIIWNILYMIALSCVIGLTAYLAIFFKKKRHFSY